MVDELVGMSDAQVNAFMAAYPTLQRMDVMGAIVKGGPFRSGVERELAYLHAARVGKAAEITTGIKAQLA